jgi:primosomal protein N' (replication factor Y) (superfamily II helicase)
VLPTTLAEVRVVDALPTIRSSSFDLPFTYLAPEAALRVGDVVRVPLGRREVVAFVVSSVYQTNADERLRRVVERLDVPRAFDETGLRLARFIAGHYLCTLGEALGAVVLAGAVPRTVDTLVRVAAHPNVVRYRSVPERLLHLMWEDLPPAFGMETLLRHPEARRAGDRRALLRHVQTLLRSGDLRRERRLSEPKVHPYRVRVLHPGVRAIRGKKAEALLAFVRERPGVPRSEAVLAGFSSSVIARAIKAGALEERESIPAPASSVADLRPALGENGVQPTGEQRAVLQSIDAWLSSRMYHEALLHGVTGSGKTYVYVEAIRRVLDDGGRAIVLVPEISLTPQTARRFEDAFGERVAVLHSALSERERFDAWQACAQGEIDVVVGARSAVFAPLSNVRLLVVDEAHEGTYKQESVPRYHAVAVARERMRASGGLLLLGSATPSLESYEAAQRGRIELLTMRERATAAAMPAVRIVDLAKEFESGNKRIFSTALVDAIADRLARKEKTVLFVNRRGSAGFVLCRSCGFVPECPRCDVSLAVHRSEGVLRCHYCDHQEPLLRSCRRCGMETIREFGVGTERVVEEVARLFPDARVMRMDSDTTTRIGDHARILSAFEVSGDVLVGTQMVAKGLDFPTVTLVGVIAADLGLHFPDFRAAERTFALIAQVCGRSGRMQPGEAIVQTYTPTHPAIVYAAAHDYKGFAEIELAERRSLQYPPYARLVYLGVIGRSRAGVGESAERYARAMREGELAEVLGPAPYPVARVNNEWRVRIALKTRSPKQLRQALRERVLPLARADRATRLAINVDP